MKFKSVTSWFLILCFLLSSVAMAQTESFKSLDAFNSSSFEINTIANEEEDYAGTAILTIYYMDSYGSINDAKLNEIRDKAINSFINNNIELKSKLNTENIKIAKNNAIDAASSAEFFSILIVPQTLYYEFHFDNSTSQGIYFANMNALVRKHNNDIYAEKQLGNFTVNAKSSKSMSWDLSKSNSVYETIKLTGDYRPIESLYFSSVNTGTTRYNFVGGAYSSFDSWGGEKHHVVADSVLPIGTTSGQGPAIRMLIEDHMNTPSWGNSIAAGEFRQKQRMLVFSGQCLAAFDLDANYIKTKWPGKYDAALSSARSYAVYILGWN